MLAPCPLTDRQQLSTQRQTIIVYVPHTKQSFNHHQLGVPLLSATVAVSYPYCCCPKQPYIPPGLVILPGSYTRWHVTVRIQYNVKAVLSDPAPAWQQNSSSIRYNTFAAASQPSRGADNQGQAPLVLRPARGPRLLRDRRGSASLGLRQGVDAQHTPVHRVFGAVPGWTVLPRIQAI